MEPHYRVGGWVNKHFCSTCRPRWKNLTTYLSFRPFSLMFFLLLFFFFIKLVLEMWVLRKPWELYAWYRSRFGLIVPSRSSSEGLQTRLCTNWQFSLSVRSVSRCYFIWILFSSSHRVSGLSNCGIFRHEKHAWGILDGSFLLHFLLFKASERHVHNWRWLTTFQFVSVTPRPLTKSCLQICSVTSSAGCSRSPKSGGNSSASVASETFLVVHEISGCNPMKTHRGNLTHHSLPSPQEVQTRGSIFF